MLSTIKEAIEAATFEILETLGRHNRVLGLGEEFGVYVWVRPPEVPAIVVLDHAPAKLTAIEWELIMARRWGEKSRRVLEAIRANGNHPVSVDELSMISPGFYAGDRDQMNRTLGKLNPPFVVKNTVRGFQGAYFYVARR